MASLYLFLATMESRIFRHPLFLIFCVFVILQGNLIQARSHLPFLPTDEGIHVNNIVSKHLGLLDDHGVRKRRNLVSTLSLLWPQVVGPIDNGVIKEESFESVPLTALERQLHGIRERSRIETETRQHVRDLLNYGTPMAKLTLQQMHALHNDMTMFWNRHNHHHPGHFHAPHRVNPTVHHVDPAAFVIHHTLIEEQKKRPEKYQSVVITGNLPGGIKIKTQNSVPKTAEEKNLDETR